MPFGPSHGAPPVTRAELAAPEEVQGRLHVPAVVDPLGPDVPLLPGGRERKADHVAVRGGERFHATGFGDGGAAGRPADVGLDDDVPAGPGVLLHFQVTEAVVADS